MAGPSRSTQSQLASARRLDPRAGRRPCLGARDPRPGAESIAPEPSSPGVAAARTTTGSSTPWSGASSPAASGASSTRRSTSSSGAGARTPESPAPIGGGRQARRPSGRSGRSTTSTPRSTIMSTSIPYGQILSTATHLSTDIDYRPVSDDEMAAALARRDQAGPAERDCYASYVNEAFLTALEAHARGDRLSVQLRRRAVAVRDGQPAVAADDRPGRRDDRPASHGCGSSVSSPAATPTSRCARWRGNCRTSAWRVTGGTTSSRTRSPR